ncbi:hypothetical protein ACJRO7_021706 [Eucalyptus globulus]|uniref:non-specific serine/threonine protein kinase n=1 Tax=Eucalyptus globulus TaxID=34317 RepID=A0ABD3KKR5_EUCGL
MPLMTSWCSCFVFCILLQASQTARGVVYNITTSEPLFPNQTLVSSVQIFELGFFTPNGSANQYVGIWYKNLAPPKIVWVANRELPLVYPDQSAKLMIGSDGNLKLLRPPDGHVLAGMRVRVNSTDGENRAFRSWKSSDNPSPGNFSMGVDPRLPPQIVIWGQSGREWRSGHWNGQIFTGVPNMTRSYLFGFRFWSIQADGSRYFTYTPLNSSNLLMFRILWNGTEEQFLWDGTSNAWTVLQEQPAKECDFYNKCGDFAICNEMDSPKCSCMEGFSPKSPDQWNRGNWSAGCARKTQLQCQDNSSRMDGFLKLDGVKLPDFADSVSAIIRDECEAKCLENCSCNAFAFDVGIGCMLWTENLIDVQHFDKGGLTLQIRLANSELRTKSKTSKLFIIITVLVGAFVLGVLVWLLWRFKDNLKGFSIFYRRNKKLPLLDNFVMNEELSAELSGPDGLARDAKQVGGADITVFNFSSIEAATNFFSEENKLGLGGFGPVYKAFKESSQGLDEFKNEVMLIEKLQHRNLVKLLGFCVQGEDKMLVYEYMPNRSLDSFIFDLAKRAKLDWKKCFEIIEGIARGLLYLHRDSRLRIIHRDLKASNILLNEEMNPKISDFGMARIFGTNENEASTNRVYAMEGLFSVKSDVYIFGVLLLEIVSGKKNFGFRTLEHPNLIVNAWHHLKEGKGMELIDPCIRDTCSTDKVLRCIQVGLLCVQDSAVDRPAMPSVMLLLESKTMDLPFPKLPRSTSITGSMDTCSLSESQEIESLNGVTVSSVDGR